MKNIKHVELFAGIGGFRQGIDLFAKIMHLIQSV